MTWNTPAGFAGVEQAGSPGSQSVYTEAYTVSVPAGALGMAQIGWVDPGGTTTITSVTDNAGGTWVSSGPKHSETSIPYAEQMFYCWGFSCGTFTVTVTFSTNAISFVDIGLCYATNTNGS